MASVRNTRVVTARAFNLSLSNTKDSAGLLLYSDPDIRRLPLVRTLLKKDGAGCSSSGAALESDASFIGGS